MNKPLLVPSLGGFSWLVVGQPRSQSKGAEKMKKTILVVLLPLLVACGTSPACPPCPECPPCPGTPTSVQVVATPTSVPSGEETSIVFVDMTYKRDSIGNFIVMGIVLNDGQVTARSLQVNCRGYAADGGLVDIHTTYAEPTTLSPGEEATFTCYLEETSAIDEYECIIYAE